MNKKIILSLGASALLVSSLFASPHAEIKQDKGFSCKQHKMMKHNKHKRHSKSRGHSMVKIFMKLDLNNKQRDEIKTLIRSSRKSVLNPHTAFSDTSFDKVKFVAITKQKREQRVERKAQLIEDIYKVLTVSQKKDFKTMLDMRDIRKKSCRSK
ncbi:MAG: Spy/CpxP family protein refolding chaperone [Sulfurovum sp.]